MKTKKIAMDHNRVYRLNKISEETQKYKEKRLEKIENKIILAFFVVVGSYFGGHLIWFLIK